MFSISFVASATSHDDTSTVRQMTVLYMAEAIRKAASVIPPTTLGIVPVENSLLLGSSRSGE